MFKNFIRITLVASLLITTIGFPISKHYSGGELFSVAIFTDAESCCEIPCDCCSDETEHYQLNTDYHLSNIKLQDIQEIDLLFADLSSLIISNSSLEKTNSFQFIIDISPPDTSTHLAFMQAFRC